MRHARTLLGALAITSASFAACGVTPGRAIEVTFTAHGSASATFTTRAGWDVTLTEAHLAVGPLYVLAGAPRTTLRELVLPVALAHGGVDEYAGREVRAEWLDDAVIDLLDPTPVTLGVGPGTAGLAEESSLTLVTPTDAGGPTRGHVAWVAGTATPSGGGTAIAFEGGLDLDAQVLARTVEPIASAFVMQTSGTFGLALDASGRTGAAPSWLEDADFARLPPPSSGTTRTLAQGTQPYVAWMLAARDAAAFETTFTPEVSP